MDPSDINRVVSKLNATIDSLTKQRNDLLGKLNAIFNVVEYAWVINNGMYYQYLSTENGVVNLFRKGQKSTWSNQHFYSDFTIADEAQVKQHVRFLNSIGEPIINYSSSVDSESSMEHEFYMVTVRGIKGATVRHENYDVAEKEAIRLAKHENHEAYILGVVAKVKPVVTHEIIKSVTTINL